MQCANTSDTSDLQLQALLIKKKKHLHTCKKHLLEYLSAHLVLRTQVAHTLKNRASHIILSVRFSFTPLCDLEMINIMIDCHSIHVSYTLLLFAVFIIHYLSMHITSLNSCAL